MRMTDFVVRDAIIPELTATGKESVIREMIGSLGAAGYFKTAETEDIVKAVLKRELLGSTGIGCGARGAIQFGSAGDCSQSRLVQQSPRAMNGEILRRKITVTDPLGLHMRPLTAFAQKALQFKSAVTVSKDDQRVNGKSPLELM